jgi:4-hydroxyphenylacetate 3-monooxygenase
MVVITQPFVEPEESFACAIPANAPGVHTVLRQTFSRPPSEREHPLASKGEEMDCLIIFDNVFVPSERVFSQGAPELALQYSKFGGYEHWHTLIRMCVKAELFAGLVQLVVTTLGTEKIAKVRELVSDVILYAQVLRAFVTAAEEGTTMTKSGVLWPDSNMVTAGRVYGVENYGSIVTIVLELAGQGPLMLFSDADFDHPELGPMLAQVIEGFDMSATEKNRLMGLVWDMTSDGYAARMDMFERLNGFPLFFLKERQYNEYDRKDAIDVMARFIGLPTAAAKAAAEAAASARTQTP